MKGKAIVASLALLVGTALPGYAATIQETDRTNSADFISWYTTQQFRVTVKPGDTLTGIASQLESEITVPEHLRIRGCASPISWQDVYRQNEGTIRNPHHLEVGQVLYFRVRDNYTAGHTGINMSL